MTDPFREIEILLFDVALQISDEEIRRTFLETACGGDPDRLSRLQKLLAAHGGVEEFFAGVTEACTPAAGQDLFSSETPVSETTGHIGSYRLLERIGEGGCGVVYLARQEGPVCRQVALKVIRPGMDTQRIVDRFEAERQALAMMDHPHIARILDAGASPTGRPYFAMELVEGEKITDFCDTHRLSIRKRISLFIGVCEAIQHAHQKGIIHRDIKPSNVLVRMQDGNPLPKVIDFGIARATNDAGWQTDHTEAGMVPFGTLACMSPEQAASGGTDVDTRSDVYSLGILLHELLSGRPAFDAAEFRTMDLPSAIDALMNRELPAPSSVIARLPAADAIAFAEKRSTDPKRWQIAVKGDLDHVVMKCLEKDRARRYATVNALAMDLSRFLRNEPVTATPASPIYRIGKFVRQNKKTCLMGAVVVLTILTGATTSTVLFLRERVALREQQRLRKAAETAHEVERMLRTQSQARENLSSAALLLSQDRLEEADEVLRETPLSTIEPSQEATSVFRKLGDWHLNHGRWNEAADSYRLLPMSNRFIPVEAIPDTADMIRTAPALVMAGRLDEYNLHRQDLLLRYQGTQSINTAEQLVKMSLLAPANKDILDRLEPTAATLKQYTSAPRDAHMHMLASVAISLFELRKGHAQEALLWTDRALPLAEQDYTAPRGTYRAFLNAIRLIAFRQLGDRENEKQLNDELHVYLETHQEAFRQMDPTTVGPFVDVIELVLSLILVREALEQN